MIKNLTGNLRCESTSDVVIHFMMKRLFCLFVILSSLFFSSGVMAQNGSYTLGHPSSGGTSVSGTASNSGLNGVSPFMSSRKESRSQYLYLADELTGQMAGAGHITSLSLNITQIPSGSPLLSNITISMGTTSALTLPATMPAAGTYPVYKTISNLSITETGWMTIDLDTDFYWNGTDNIIVEICKSASTAIAGNFKVQTTQFSTDRTRGLFTNINASPSFVTGCNMQGGASAANNTATISPTTNRKFRPDIKFTFACSGTPSPAGSAVILNPGTHCYGDTVILGISHGSDSARLEYQWESSNSPAANSFIPVPGATDETLQVLKGPEDKYYRRKTGCGGNFINSAAVLVQGVNTWNGSIWSKGEPSTSESVIIAGDFTSTCDLTFCSMIVNSGNMVISSGFTLTLANEVVVNGGTLTFEDSATLLQQNPTAVNSGNIIYKRKSQPVRRYDFTYWSSPVQSQTLYNLSPLTLVDKFLSFNTATQNWQIESPSGAMLPGKGYIIRAPQTYATTGAGSVFTGSFQGVPNNGEISTAVVGSGHWNLLGNPYPGSLDANDFLSDPENSQVLDGTIYLWTHNSAPVALPGNGINYSGSDYALYNYTGGLGGSGSAATGLGNNEVPNGYIGAGQSFMIKGANSGGVAKFKNSMRSAGHNAQFFKNSSQTETPANEDFQSHKLYLELTNTQGHFKQLLLGYVTGATNGFDRSYDGLAIDGNGISFFTIADSLEFGIQGRALPFSSTDEVPLGYKSAVAGNHIISLYDYNGLFGEQDVFLEDRLLQTVHNLKTGGYEFASPAGTFKDRFVLKYSETALGTGDIENNPEAIVVYKGNDAININSGSKNIQSLDITDVNGRILFSQKGINAPVTSVNSSGWTPGLLLIRITLEQNVIFVKKILL
ncbi:MAG TPA: hypothetical protein VGB50_03595 [Flavobacterium sp.]